MTKSKNTFKQQIMLDHQECIEVNGTIISGDVDPMEMEAIWVLIKLGKVSNTTAKLKHSV